MKVQCNKNKKDNNKCYCHFYMECVVLYAKCSVLSAPYYKTAKRFFTSF